MWERRSGRLPVELETANALNPQLEQELLTALAKFWAPTLLCPPESILI